MNAQVTTYTVIAVIAFFVGMVTTGLILDSQKDTTADINAGQHKGEEGDGKNSVD